MRARAAALLLAAALTSAAGATERFAPGDEPEHAPAPPPALDAGEARAANAIDARWAAPPDFAHAAGTVLGEAAMNALYGHGWRMITAARAEPGTELPIPVDASTEALTVITVGAHAPRPTITQEGAPPLEARAECAKVGETVMCTTAVQTPTPGTYWVGAGATETITMLALAEGKADRLGLYENEESEVWARFTRRSEQITGLEGEAFVLDPGWRPIERVVLADDGDGFYRGTVSQAVCPERCTVLVRLWGVRKRARTTMKGTTAHDPSFDDHRNTANAVDDPIERTGIVTVVRKDGE